MRRLTASACGRNLAASAHLIKRWLYSQSTLKASPASNVRLLRINNDRRGDLKRRRTIGACPRRLFDSCVLTTSQHHRSESTRTIQTSAEAQHLLIVIFYCRKRQIKCLTLDTDTIYCSVRKRTVILRIFGSAKGLRIFRRRYIVGTLTIRPTLLFCIT